MAPRDFNLPHIDWESSTFRPGDNNLQQIVRKPTRLEHTPDLCFTNSPALVESVKVVDGISDHDMVVIQSASKSKINRPPKRKVYLYKHGAIKRKKANFKGINKDMEDFNESLNHERVNSLSVEELYSAFKAELQSSIDRHIP